MAIGKTAGVSKSVKSTAAIVVANTIAKFGADDDTMSIAAAASDNIVGVFQHTTAVANEQVEVMLTGISDIKLGGTVTRGDLITSDAAGKGIVTTQHTHTENIAGVYAQGATTGVASAVRVIGKALQSGVNGDIISILLGPYAA